MLPVTQHLGGGYRIALSKRTTLYTTYTSADNDRQRCSRLPGPVGNICLPRRAHSTFTAGINHAF